MTLPRNLAAYKDVEAILERALHSPNGIEVEMPTYSQAIRLQQKMNVYRKRLREDSTERHRPGDPGYGESPYDNLVISLNRDDTKVRIRENVIEPIAIRDLDPEPTETP